MEWGVYLSGGTLLALIMAAVKLTWQVRDIEKSIKAEIKKDVKGIVDELKSQVVEETKKREALREEVDGREETLRKEMGELGNALRQHIHQIETWSRDEFVLHAHTDDRCSLVGEAIYVVADCGTQHRESGCRESRLHDGLLVGEVQ